MRIYFFFKINLFQTILSGTLSQNQTVWIQDQDRHSVGPDYEFKLFANVISRRKKSLLAREEVNQ